jgi:putative peptidoglycan lipid II flippase
LIGSALWLTPLFEIGQTGIDYGVLLAGLLQWLFLWPSLLKTGVWRPWEWHRKHPGVKKIGLLMIPGLFAVSVSQINLLLDTVLASMLEDGSVTWLYFSDRLTELPLGVVGIAIATVLLPRLSALHADSDPLQFEKTLAWAIRLVIMIGLPAAIALALIPDVLITLLFENGKFNAEDVLRSAPSLAAYAFGLPAFMLIKVLAPAFFARQDTKTPVKIGIQAMVWNMVFNLVLIIPFAHVGLAAATSMSAWLNACLLAWHLKKSKRLPTWQSVSHSISRTLVACIVMAGVILWLMSLTVMQMPADLIGQIRVVSVFVGAGMASYAIVLFVTGVKLAEIRHP